MPELPEVEVVRRGLAGWTIGARIAAVSVFDERSLRRHLAGAEDFTRALIGRRIADVVRRGKYLWVVLDGDDDVEDGRPAEPTALLAHLGMSGQILLQPASAPAERHLRIAIALTGLPPAETGADAGPPHNELRFVDQRIFGGMQHSELVPTGDGRPGGLGASPDSPALIPPSVAHIARDPLDPAFDDAAFAAAVRRRKTGIKRALLDQGLVSGIGNIYADEALWIARVHYARPTETLTRPVLDRLLAAAREVMAAALAAGGTSFDSLYVNVNGESGYFERSLNVYGREGARCRRCETTIERAKFMNRSSYFCPACQKVPRNPRW